MWLPMDGRASRIENLSRSFSRTKSPGMAMALGPPTVSFKESIWYARAHSVGS